MIRTASAISVLLVLLACSGSAPDDEALDARPNIILIMTDDQGWAQLGVHGDPVLQTPNLDRFAEESVELTRFYVAPVCAPTRASLMTGRYHYRTGVVDTYLGRALMAADETTIAEMLSDEGYRTGIFGKWHLGDNYPMRAIDQGFQEAILHRGGGIGQPSDAPGTDYFDPILYHNGEEKRYEGYCTDIYFDEAIRFINESMDAPFFVYLPTNAPHSPYLVPASYRERYTEQGLEDKDARIYGMIENIDDNVGKLLTHLADTGRRDNTIVIFMTDNGPTTRLFDAGLRAQKTSVYEGGIRVPFFIRWPARIQPKKVETIAAHIDVAPTLMDAVGSPLSPAVEVDGRSLMPLLSEAAPEWRERLIFIQAHRGNEPEIWRNAAAIGQQYKIVQPLSFARPMPRDAQRELYDLEADPGEQNDLSQEIELRQQIRRLNKDYEIWFQDVGRSRGYAPQRIYLGAPEENPVTLTRQDWRVTGSGTWAKGDTGAWAVEVRVSGDYAVKMDFDALEQPARIELEIGSATKAVDLGVGADSAEFPLVELQRGAALLEARIETGDQVQGVNFVHVTKL